MNIVFLLIVAGIYSVSTASKTYAIGDIYFPVLNGASFRDDFYAARSNGQHLAIDIFNARHTPLIAATSGTITFAPSPQPSYGYMVQITDAEGYKFNYIHINNDTVGTDDGAGGEMFAYASDIKSGNKVEKGQLIGWMGDSGNAENTPPHLHFEIESPTGEKINPYPLLVRAPRVNTPSLYPQLKNELLPYWVEFTGGLNIAMADFDKDGISELVTAAGVGGGPHVKIYDSTDNLLGEFFAYTSNFRGGIDVAAGDVDGDGVDEIITGPGAGGGPWVRAFKLNGQIIAEFSAYDPVFKGGIDVASGDVIGDMKEEIITAPGAGGGPHIKTFNQQGDVMTDFFAYSSDFRGGVKISAGNIRKSRAKDEILTLPAEYGGSHVRLLGADGTNLRQSIYLESWWRGYYDVAAGSGESRLATGINRRASVRIGPN